jgi:hypothetical protein
MDARHRTRNRCGRSGRGTARWCSGGPICCRPFRLTVPYSPLHHSVPGLRHIEPDRRVPASGSPRRCHPSGLCFRSVGARVRARIRQALVPKETPRPVHDVATPPLPTESLALTRLGRESPHFAFTVVRDLVARVADLEVVSPSPRGSGSPPRPPPAPAVDHLRSGHRRLGVLLQPAQQRVVADGQPDVHREPLVGRPPSAYPTPKSPNYLVKSRESR